MTFRVGMKVECWRVYGSRPFAAPKVGDIFTVARTGFGINQATGKFAEGLGFIEIGNLWDKHCFRPLASRPTDISIFTAMLNPSQVTVDAMNMADLAREIHG